MPLTRSRARARAIATTCAPERIAPLAPSVLTLAALAALLMATSLPAQETGTTAEPTESAEASGDTASSGMIETYGYSYFGELEYPADYPHYRYVNPEAPKGGEISLGVSGTFDSMNPFSRKGRAAVLSSVMYESLLADAPGDEYSAQYCLLCESLEYDEGKTYVIFNMRPEARFSDGTPLTAHDVVFSHNLFLEQGLPSYAAGVSKRLINVEALDDHTVKFDFAPDIPRRSLIDQAGAVPVFSRAWYEENGARLDESRMETSPGSGPYMVDQIDVNRRVSYRRNPDYWGADLPVNIGRHNFDRIRFEYFSDETAAFEAFKAGEYTIRVEGNSRLWATAYDFPAAQRGLVVREEIPDGSPPLATGFVFNLAREPLQDKRVRQALALAFNFEWTNESLQYGLFQHRSSFNQDTPLQAQGAPEGAELQLLESLGDLVPEEMLTAEPVMAHTSSPERLNDRRNLRRAMGLLDEAGWAVGDDGMRRNAEGELLTIEIPVNSVGAAVLESVIETYIQNMRTLGVDAQMEKVDPSQYTNRERDRDYDMIYDYYRPFLEAGTGLMQMYGSSEAQYSLFNPAGLASPLVDAIIQASLETETQETQDAALRALDRALRHEFIIVPAWYKADHWVAYWDMYGHPEEIPPFELGYLDFWWYDAEKGEQLRATGALR